MDVDKNKAFKPVSQPKTDVTRETFSHGTHDVVSGKSQHVRKQIPRDAALKKFCHNVVAVEAVSLFTLTVTKLPTGKNCLWLKQGHAVNLSTQIRTTACQKVQPLANTLLGHKVHSCHAKPSPSNERQPQGGPSLLFSQMQSDEFFRGPSQKTSPEP